MTQKQGSQDPKSGERSPTNPADQQTRGGKSKDAGQGDPRANNMPAWVVALPPEVRDALAGGRAEDIPQRYRKLIRAYTLWLQKNPKNRR